MRSKSLFKTMISVITFAVILVLLAACSGASSGATQINATSDIQVTPITRVEAQLDSGTPVPAAIELATSQVPPIQNGTALLERHCAKCHLVQSLQQIKKPRSEWEKILAQMEGMGLHLDDNEKVDLLNYLTVADQP